MADKTPVSRTDTSLRETAESEKAAAVEEARGARQPLSPQVTVEPVDTQPAADPATQDPPADEAPPADDAQVAGNGNSADPGVDADPATLIDLTEGTVDAPTDNDGARIVSDVTKEPRTDPDATVDQASASNDPPPTDQGSTTGGHSDDPVEGVDTSSPDEVPAGPRAAVDPNDEQAMRDWAVDQFGEEAVAEQEAGGGGTATAGVGGGGGAASGADGGGGGGSSIPTHGSADVPQGAEFAERNPLAGDEGEQLQSLESLDSLLDADSGVPGMASPGDYGSNALPEIREDPAMDRSDIMGVSDALSDAEKAAENSKAVQAANARIAEREAMLKEEPAPAPAPKEPTIWERIFGKSGDAGKIGEENLTRADAAAKSDPTNTEGNAGKSTPGEVEAAIPGVSPRGVDLPVKKQGAPRDPGPDGEGGTYEDPTGRHRQMIDDVQDLIMDSNPADTGNVDPADHDYGSGEPVAETDRTGVENPSEDGGGRVSGPNIGENQGGLIDPNEADDTSVGSDGAYNTDTDVTTNVDDGTVDDPTDTGNSGDSYEVTTLEPGMQPGEHYVVDDPMVGE